MTLCHAKLRIYVQKPNSGGKLRKSRFFEVEIGFLRVAHATGIGERIYGFFFYKMPKSQGGTMIDFLNFFKSWTAKIGWKLKTVKSISPKIDFDPFEYRFSNSAIGKNLSNIDFRIVLPKKFFRISIFEYRIIYSVFE